MNATLDAFEEPVRVSYQYVQQLSRGVVPQPIDAAYQGEFGKMKQGWNALIGTLKDRSKDLKLLMEAAVAGHLHVRADTSKYEGFNAEMMNSVNALLDRVVEPFEAAAAHVDRLSKGDVPPPITDAWPGDLDRLRQNLNRCAEAVGALVEDAKGLSAAAVAGRLSTRADATRHEGDFRRIVEGVNETLDAVVAPLNTAAAYVDRTRPRRRAAADRRDLGGRLRTR